MNRLRRAWDWIHAKGAEIGTWLGENHEAIKMIFVPFVAFWVLLEYWDKQDEARVARTLPLISRLTEKEFLAEKLARTQYWSKPETVAHLKSIAGDKAVYAAFVTETVDKSQAKEVWHAFALYNELAICVNSGLCDAKTACSHVKRDFQAFTGTYAPYFERYRANFGDDVLQPMRTMVANQDCK